MPLKFNEILTRQHTLTEAPCVTLNQNPSKNTKDRSIRKVNCNLLVKWPLKQQKKKNGTYKGNKNMYRMNTNYV